MAVPQGTRAPVIFVLEPFGGSIRRNNPNLPFIFWDDAAVTRGDGVFETLLIRDGKAANLRRHAERFRSSARLLDMPEPDAGYWARATAEAAEAWVTERGEGVDAKCVWTYTRGRASTGFPSAWLVLSDIPQKTLDQRANGVKVMTTPRGFSVDTTLPGVDEVTRGGTGPGEERRVAPWLTVGAKTLNYAANMAALRWAHAHGTDDVIYVDPRDVHPDKGPRVLEGATSTVVLAKSKKRLRTPVPGGEVLPGTTQAALFEHAEAAGWRCKARDIYLRDLKTAESVWLVSSVRVAARVLSLDGKTLEVGGDPEEVRALIEGALGS